MTMIPAREGAAEAARTKNQNQAGTGMFTRHLHTLAFIPSQPRLLVPDSSQALDYAWTRWQPSYLVRIGDSTNGSVTNPGPWLCCACCPLVGAADSSPASEGVGIPNPPTRSNAGDI